MLRLTGPDHAVYTYGELREQLISPPAWNPEAIHGELHAPTCKSCGFFVWKKTWSRKRGRRTICARCGADWVVEDAASPKIRLKRRIVRSDPLAAKFSELATLHVLIFGKPRDLTYAIWEYDLYCYLTLLLRCDTLREIGEVNAEGVRILGAREWPNAPRPWNQWSVRRAKRAAQDVVGARIDRARARGEIR